MARSRNRRVSLKTKNRYKRSIQGLINGMSREIVIYQPELRQECPNCYYDKVNDRSTGITKVNIGDPGYFLSGRCPVCKGRGVIITKRKKCITGLVIWNLTGDAMNNNNYTPAGFDSATRVEIKVDPCYLDLIKESVYIVIDGIRCKLSNPPIIRGLGNKSLLVAHLFVDTKASMDSGEYV